MKARLSSLVLVCMVVTNPLASFSVWAQTAGFNPNAPTPGRLGLSRNKTLGDLGSFESDGGFRINDPKTLSELGYDPSRIWKKGDNIADGVQVGDVDGVFKIKDLTPRQIAKLSGTSVNKLPLVNLFGEQSIGDLIKLNPDLADAPAESIPAIRDLVQGNYSSAIKSGIIISESYSKDVKEFLDDRPELRNLPIKSILKGDFKGALPVAQATAFRELQAKLPEQFKALPIKSLPALTELSKGNIGGAVQSGFEISVDHFETLEKFIDKHPELKNAPISAIINRDWGKVASSAEKLAFKKLAKTLPASTQGFAGRSVPLFQAARKGDFSRVYSISGESIKEFNKFLDRNPHLKNLPLNQILRGDIQAALPRAEQAAIYEIAKKLPDNYKVLPSQALGALRDLRQGRWENSIEKGVAISSEHFKAIQTFYKAHPELENVAISDVLKGDFDTAIDAGEKAALKRLEKINPYLGELPLGAIAKGNYKQAFNKGIKVGAGVAIDKLIKDNPALKDVAVGALDNPRYSIGSVEGLADTTLATINGIDGKAISKIPGLNKVPLDFVNANNLSALFKGDLFLTLDLPYGKAEKVARNALSGFTRGKKFTPTPCSADDSKTDNCSHIELTDKKGTTGDGKQFVLGSGHKGKGGWGFLKNIGNGGYEKTGLAPWGVSAKTSNLKLVINKIEETGGTQTTTPSGFRVATESGYAEFGLTFGICIKKLFIDTCTSSFIDLPIEFIPKELIDFKVAERGRVLIATTSPPPKIPRRLRRKYRRQLGLPGDEYCDAPTASQQPNKDGTYEDASPEDLVQVGTYHDRPEFIHKDLVPVWERMKADAAKDGVNLGIASGVRTKKDQQSIWDYKRDELKQSDEQIAKVNTRPGYSEHHTGYVIDIIDLDNPSADFNNSFRDTPSGQWLAKNASKYGLEKSYPHEDNNGIQREEWHWRYVGSEKAKLALNLGGGHSDDDGHNHGGDAAIASVNVPQEGVSLDGIREAIIGKESGYDYKAVNRDSGALGFGQVMPENVASWTQAALGRAMTPSEFLNNPDAQIKTINHRLGIYLDRELAATGGDAQTAIRRVASTWYSGRPKLYNNPTPEYYNGGSYPSIRDYTLDVLDRYNANPQGGRVATASVSCIASTGGGFSQGDGKATGSFSNPLPGSSLTSPYGWRIRPGTNLRRFHKGIDLSTGVRGTPILAADGGKVVYVKRTCVEGDRDCGGQFGNRVEIDHGNGVITAYNHLQNVDVVEGQSISKGQKIGGEGSTGYSTGPHLDFQVFKGNISNHVNPAPYLR